MSKTYEELLAQNQKLHDEIGVLYDRLEELDPSYCQECGSCGETGCCPPTNCESVKCLFGEYNIKEYHTTCTSAYAGEIAIKHILSLYKNADPYEYKKIDVVPFLLGLHELLEKIWDVRLNANVSRDQVRAQCKAVEAYITTHCGE